MTPNPHLTAQILGSLKNLDVAPRPNGGEWQRARAVLAHEVVPSPQGVTAQIADYVRLTQASISSAQPLGISTPNPERRDARGVRLRPLSPVLFRVSLM